MSYNLRCCDHPCGFDNLDLIPDLVCGPDLTLQCQILFLDSVCWPSLTCGVQASVVVLASLTRVFTARLWNHMVVWPCHPAAYSTESNRQLHWPRVAILLSHSWLLPLTRNWARTEEPIFWSGGSNEHMSDRALKLTMLVVLPSFSFQAIGKNRHPTVIKAKDNKDLPSSGCAWKRQWDARVVGAVGQEAEVSTEGAFIHFIRLKS